MPIRILTLFGVAALTVGCSGDGEPIELEAPLVTCNPHRPILFVQRNAITEGWSHGGHIRAFDPATHAMTMLVPGQDAQRPRWSADGAQVLFTISTSKASESSVHVMAADGSGQHVVTAGGRIEDWPSWSPRRAELAFSSGPESSLYRVNADGTNLVHLTTGGDSMPVWSKDGESIVFVSYRDGLPSTGRLYVMNRDGTGQRRLTSSPATTGETNPRFSPDGTKLVFETYHYDATMHAISFGPTYIADADGTNLEDLNARFGEPTTAPAPLAIYWSPDMTKIAYVSAARGEVVVHDLALGTSRVVGTGLIRGDVVWNATSDVLAFRIGWLEGRNLYVFDLKTDTIEQVTTTGDIDGHFRGLDWGC